MIGLRSLYDPPLLKANGQRAYSENTRRTSMMNPALSLDEVISQLNELADRLKSSHDAAEREMLLRELRLLLDQADKLNNDSL